MSGPKVIVFGPTGAVGSAVARVAAEHGAKVVLAMRNTAKAIPGLDAATEQKHGYERVTADLLQPATVRAAVSQTGATRAFFYLQSTSTDHMRGTVEALKAGGVELPVFLSSFTVYEDLAAHPEDPIGYIHTMVEQTLADVYGAANYVSLRPGFFASNCHWYDNEIARGTIHLWAPNASVDGITTDDIGAVGGKVLAKGRQDTSCGIYLYGPTLMSQKEMIQTLLQELGSKATIEIVADPDVACKQFIEDRGFPEMAAHSTVKTLRDDPVDGNVHGSTLVVGLPIDKAHLGNVEKYAGKRPMTFTQWVQENKASFRI